MRRALVFAALLLAALASAQERRIEKSAVIDAPVPEVWKAWTTSAGLESFFCPKATVELRQFGKYELEFASSAPVGLRGTEGCRVLSYVPEKMLSFSWNAPPDQPDMRYRKTFVVLSFSPAGNGKTKLELSHGGWQKGAEWDETYKYFDQAWTEVLGACQDHFRNPTKPNPAPAPTAKPARNDAALEGLGRLIGGVWRSTIHDDQGKPMVIEFRYKRHPDGVGIIGEGEIGKGRKDVTHVRTIFGWDPEAKAVYYLDCHNSGTIYFGHVYQKKDELTFIFGPLGGDPNAFLCRSLFTGPNAYRSIIRDAGKDIDGFTMKRA